LATLSGSRDLTADPTDQHADLTVNRRNR